MIFQPKPILFTYWALNTLLFPQKNEFEQEEEPIRKMTDSIVSERQEVPSKVPKITKQCPNDDSKKIDTQISKQTPEHIITKQEQFKDTDDETDSDITPSDEVNKDENKFYTILFFMVTFLKTCFYIRLSLFFVFSKKTLTHFKSIHIS